MVEAMPYLTPVVVVGKKPYRMDLIECADCDWFTVVERGDTLGSDQWETHHGYAHSPRSES